MSILVTVGAIIMVSFLPGKEAGDTNAKSISDVEKLETVEEHMRSFMAFNRRRPCPAAGSYGVNSANFGKEAAIAGTCSGGTPAAPLSDGGNIVAGTIPTRSLGLDASYAFDSYGRRFTYVVDKRATSTATCDALEGITTGSTTPTGKGGLYVNDIAGNPIDQVMYAYIQHGPSGYGAFPGQGSTATGRINSGSTNKFMQVDAAVAVGANPGSSTFVPTLTNTLIKNSMTLPTTSGGLDTGFNDLLWYRDDIKNTCCLGKKCIPLGFRVDDSTRIDVVGMGDINGDGHSDLVLMDQSNAYVIFGTSNMSNSSNSPWPIPPTGLDPTTLNGTNGFVIPSVGHLGNPWTVSVTDINGDGYADIFVCSYWGPSCYVIFGGPGGVTTPWLPSGNTINLAALSGYTGVNGTSGVTINTLGIDGNASVQMSGGTTAVGKIDDSGYKSLIALGRCYPGGCNDTEFGFVLYGMPSGTAGSNTPGTWSGTPSITVSDFNGTAGFEIHSSLSTTLGTGHDLMGQSFDFDRDTYDDILIGAGGASGAPITHYGAIYAIYGRPRSYWSASLTGTSPAFLDIAAELNAANSSTHCNSTITCATEFYNSQYALDYGYNNALFGADLKGGSSNPYDMVTGGMYSGPPIVAYGGTRYPATFDLNTLTAAEGFSVALASCCNGLPSWFYAVSGVAVADVNGDGHNDLLLTTANGAALYINGRRTPGAVVVFYQPSGGWPSVVDYNNFHWDGTDSFMIEGPETNSNCGWASSPFVGDVRTGDNGAPEIMVACDIGEPGSDSIYGLYKNKGWPSSIDLNQLN